MELDLTLRSGALEKLLAFLAFSFGGGTDVDRPLELSLSRLEHNDWQQVMLARKKGQQFMCQSQINMKCGI